MRSPVTIVICLLLSAVVSSSLVDSLKTHAVQTPRSDAHVQDTYQVPRVVNREDVYMNKFSNYLVATTEKSFFLTTQNPDRPAQRDTLYQSSYKWEKQTLEDGTVAFYHSGLKKYIEVEMKTKSTWPYYEEPVNARLSDKLTKFGVFVVMSHGPNNFVQSVAHRGYFLCLMIPRIDGTHPKTTTPVTLSREKDACRFTFYK